MARTPGSGRQAGSPNKITTAFKYAVRVAFDDIGGRRAFADWARANPGDFYRIAARLIPAEVNVREDRAITVIIQRGVDCLDVDAGQPPVPTLKGYVEQ
jgi:hypothetical protein